MLHKTAMLEEHPVYARISHGLQRGTKHSDACPLNLEDLGISAFVHQYLAVGMFSCQWKRAGWGDIAYNFLIGGDGRAYEAIGWSEPGAHSINFNAKSIGIAFIGNFMTVEPSQKMVDAALNLIECGAQKGYLTPTREIHGHRDVACSESPGDKLYAIIRRWKYYKGGRLPLYNCP